MSPEQQPQTPGGDAPSPTPVAAGTPTRAACIQAAAEVWAEGLLAAERTLTPREQAEAAWHPGCRRTVDDLEDEIRADRGLPPIHQQPTTRSA